MARQQKQRQQRQPQIELPPPEAFGCTGFDSWRPYQSDAIQRCADSKNRHIVLVAPTGSGKSLTYLIAALLRNQRAVILTSTKGLQSQLTRDYGDMFGLVDMRGRGNYECRAVADGTSCEFGPCVGGARCSLKDGGCTYYDALSAAKKARFVVTNYAYWANIQRYGEGLGSVDLVICDEAHNAPAVLSSMLTVQFDKVRVGDLLPQDRALKDMTITDWADWAKMAAPRMAAEAKVLYERLRDSGGGSREERQELARLRKVLNGAALLTTATPEEWICRVTENRIVRLTPVWPGRYTERWLFFDAPTVICTSATVCPKTMSMLGVPEEALDYMEFPHTFPVANRRLVHIPTIRLNFRTSDMSMRRWVIQMDNIIRQRRDRKGIVHTISYKRRDLVLQHSANADIMLTHNANPTMTEQAVRKFKQSAPPSVLVSPSMATGWDFPGSECEYQIIGKLPYPDTSDEITAARCKADNEYAGYVAMQELVQTCGRGVRSATDRCENFIIDDNISWFLPRNKQFAPGWFLDAVGRSATVPKPPPKITEED